jgi:transposase-like protein
MSKKRKQYTPEEKVTILRKHLVDKVAVSDLCEVYGLQPTVFYRWQKAFFENGGQAFQRAGDRQTIKLKGRIAELEAKLAKKNEVLGEVMEEMVALKKTNGAS